MERRAPSDSHSPQRRGFTLIELLVVIAIIAILAAILFPVFAKARAKSHQAACLSNMKQIASALLMYAQDYDETLPYQDPLTRTTNNDIWGVEFYADPTQPSWGINWIFAISPYSKNWSFFHCNSAVPSRPPVGNNDTNYLLNGVVNARKLAVIPNPADIVWAHESNTRDRIAWIRPRLDNNSTTMWQQWNPGANQGAPIYDNNHNEGGNRVFCDGHAKWTKNSAICCMQYGLLPTNTPSDCQLSATGVRRQAAF